MPCMCGSTDCWSCGPAQGYEVVRTASGRWVNPEPDWESELEHFGLTDLREAISVLQAAAAEAEKGEFKAADEMVTAALEQLQGVGL
jgi:hypothetical protein